MLKEMQRITIGKEHENLRLEKHFNSKEDCESKRKSDPYENHKNN